MRLTISFELINEPYTAEKLSISDGNSGEPAQAGFAATTVAFSPGL
jgi:hypothetical protein